MIRVLLFVCASTSVRAYRGEGTAYSAPNDMDATGQNMCEFDPFSLPAVWQRYYAALSQNEWETNGMYDVCGRCIRACGTEKDAEGRCVVAMVVDQCPDWACDPGNVDFSTVALEAATGYDWDRKRIEWDFVDCEPRPSSDMDDGERTANAATNGADEMDDGERTTANAATNGAIAQLGRIAADASDVLDSLSSITQLGRIAADASDVLDTLSSITQPV